MSRFLYIGLIFLVLPKFGFSQDVFTKNVTAIYFETRLQDILDDFQKKYNLQIYYSSDFINLSQEKTIDCRNQNLKKVIEVLFEDEPIDYNFLPNALALRKLKQKNNSLSFSGKIIDKVNYNPISFANISLENTQKGTSANEEGEFNLILDSLPANIVVTHLGYSNRRIRVSKDSLFVSIALSPAICAIEEVKVEPLDIYTVVEKAYKIIRSEMDKSYYGEAYYRQKTSNNSVYSEFVEGLYEVELSEAGIKDWKIINGRYLLRDDINTNDYVANLNFTWFYKYFKTIDNNAYSFLFPISPKVRENFDLQRVGYVQYGNKLLTIVGFSSMYKNP